MTRTLLYLTFIVVASVGGDNNVNLDTESFANGHAISFDSDCYNQLDLFELSDDACVAHPKVTQKKAIDSYLAASALLSLYQPTNSFYIRGPPTV